MSEPIRRPLSREQALQWCRAIQRGEGLDRTADLERVPRGELAESSWDDPRFTLGLEYGALLALVRVFGLDLSREDGGLASTSAAPPLCPVVIPSLVLIFRGGLPPSYVVWSLPLDRHGPAPARHPSAWARTLEEARAAIPIPPLSECPRALVEDYLRPFPAAFTGWPEGYVGLCMHGEFVEAWG